MDSIQFYSEKGYKHIPISMVIPALILQPNSYSIDEISL
jgi:hypothetical protein